MRSEWTAEGEEEDRDKGCVKKDLAEGEWRTRTRDRGSGDCS